MVIDKINEMLVKEEVERKVRVRSSKYNPSSFGRCFRYQVWNRQNKEVTNPIPHSTLLRFKVGTKMHEAIQALYPKECCEVEIDLADIKGFVDIVSCGQVIEIKSKNMFGFKLMKKSGYRVEDKETANILQVMFYAMVMECDSGVLLYIDTNTMETLEFELELKDWVGAVKEELEILRMFWNKAKDGLLPAPLPRAYGGKECKYCGFYDACQEEESKKRGEL